MHRSRKSGRFQMANQSSLAAEWINYSPDDKSFQVEFPSMPVSWTTDFTSPEYGKTEVYHVSVEADENMLGVNYNDYPIELEESEIDTELKSAYALPDTDSEILETAEVTISEVAAIKIVSKTGPIYMVMNGWFSRSTTTQKTGYRRV